MAPWPAGCGWATASHRLRWQIRSNWLTDRSPASTSQMANARSGSGGRVRKGFDGQLYKLARAGLVPGRSQRLGPQSAWLTRLVLRVQLSMNDALRSSGSARFLDGRSSPMPPPRSPSQLLGGDGLSWQDLGPGWRRSPPQSARGEAGNDWTGQFARPRGTVPAVAASGAVAWARYGRPTTPCSAAVALKVLVQELADTSERPSGLSGRRGRPRELTHPQRDQDLRLGRAGGLLLLVMEPWKARPWPTGSPAARCHPPRRPGSARPSPTPSTPPTAGGSSTATSNQSPCC